MFLGVTTPHPKGAGSQRPPNFWDTHTYDKKVSPRAPKFVMITHMRRGVFSVVSHASVPSGGSQRLQKFFGPLTRMRNDSQILRGDQTRCEENFYRKIDHEC